MVKINTYEELRAYVVEQGELTVEQMSLLKDIERAGRLGKLVRDKISVNLRQHGLGHLPPELPNDQSDEVRLYVLNGPVGQTIEAVLRPSRSGDNQLRALTNTTAGKKLAEVRSAAEELIELIDS